MTQNDRLEVVRRIIDANGVADVARKIGRSPTAVSQVNSGKYAGNPKRIIELILAEYTADTIICPVLGEIPIADCLDARRRAEMPYFPSSGQTTALYEKCPTCPHNIKNGGKS